MYKLCIHFFVVFYRLIFMQVSVYNSIQFTFLFIL